MSVERSISIQGPVDRFVEILDLGDVKPGEEAEREIKVGSKDRVKVYFSSPEKDSVTDRVYLRCSVYTDENEFSLVDFAVGDGGPEYIGFGNLNFEEAGVKHSLRLDQSIQIGAQLSSTKRDDIKKIRHQFGDLSYVLAKWLEGSIEEGRITELPLKVSTASK